MKIAMRRRLNRSTWGVVWLGGLLACMISPSHAARLVRWHEVTVPQAESSGAFQDAMRIALVRATGRRDADSDPALEGLLAQPRRYVQVFRAAPSGGTQITFDGAAIERAIVAAGRSVWPRERPFVLVLTQNAAPEADADAKQKLTDTAQLRGLPIALGAASTYGVPAIGEVARDVALAAAQRAGADAVVVGDSAGGVWRWSMFSATMNEAWSGSAADGVHGAADAMVRAAEAVAALPEFDTVIEVTGIATLKDFAVVSGALAGLNGVRRAYITEASVNTAVFSVTARGGIDTLMTGLAGDSRFQRAEPLAGGAVAFRFRP